MIPAAALRRDSWRYVASLPPAQASAIRLAGRIGAVLDSVEDYGPDRVRIWFARGNPQLPAILSAVPWILPRGILAK